MRRFLVVAAVAAALALGAAACGGGTYMSMGVSASPYGVSPTIGIGWTGRPF